MIVGDPEELYREVTAAESLRDDRLHAFDKMQSRYHGPFYRGDDANEEWFPSNAYFETIAMGVPSIVFDNPRWSVTAKRGEGRDTAVAMRHGLNRWTKDTKLDVALQECAHDGYFNWGVGYVAQEALPGVYSADAWRIDLGDGTDGKLKKGRTNKGTARPRFYPLSQRDYFIDPKAKRRSMARYEGHHFIRSRRDCMQEAYDNPDSGWAKETLLKMETAARYRADHDDRMNPGRADNGRDSLDRDDVEGWEIWIPEIALDDSEGPEEGYHGTLYTITAYETEEGLNAVEWLREPRAFFGPPWGPYHMFGIYGVKDEPYPLAPLVAVEGQIVALNRKVLAVNRADIGYKRLVLYDETDTDAAEKLNSTPDGYFCAIANLESSNVKEIQIGGSTAEQHQGVMVDQDRLDRTLGASSASRGNPESGVTATADTIASDAAGSRQGHIKKQFTRFVQGIGESVAWYFIMDDRVEFPVGGPEADKELGPGAIFHGGRKDEDGETQDVNPEDFELTIEPYSMERADQGLLRQNRQMGIEMLGNFGPAMVQAPWIKWGDAFNDYGDTINWPGFGDLIDEAKLAEATQMMYEASAGGGDPRYSRDISGSARSGKPGGNFNTPQRAAGAASPGRPALPPGPNGAVPSQQMLAPGGPA